MREYGFTITEHDPDRPWIVLAIERRTVKLPDGRDFFAWVHEQWPAPRWSVELDPWELGPRAAGMSPGADSFPFYVAPTASWNGVSRWWRTDALARGGRPQPPGARLCTNRGAAVALARRRC
jgi:hypothetical protein